MALISLTDANLQQVLVNPAHIAFVGPAADNTAHRIVNLTSGIGILVSNSLNSVLRKVREAELGALSPTLAELSADAEESLAQES